MQSKSFPPIDYDNVWYILSILGKLYIYVIIGSVGNTENIIFREYFLFRLMIRGGYKMRMLLNVRFPHEPFNTLVKEGRAGEIIRRILDDLKPESVYFTEQGGTSGAVGIIDVDDPSRIPFFAEPFFLNFNADCEFRIAMSPADLGKASLDELGQKWG